MKKFTLVFILLVISLILVFNFLNADETLEHLTVREGITRTDRNETSPNNQQILRQAGSSNIDRENNLPDQGERGAERVRVPREKTFSEQLENFYDIQKTPLTTAHAEEHCLGDVIWQRRYGEKKFHLAPVISDFDSFYTRIKADRNRKNDSDSKGFYLAKVQLNPSSISLLAEVNIYVPEYYTKGSVKVFLHHVDISMLQNNHVTLEILPETIDFNEVINIDENRTSEQIWFEGWEGSMAPYSIGYASDAAQTQWNDVNNTSYEGNWSLWCAGGGPNSQPWGTNYVNNMNTYVFKTTGIDISGYTNWQFRFRRKHEIELDYDFMYRYFKSSHSGNWILSSIGTYTGTTSGWPNEWHLHSLNLTGTGWSDYYNWRFEFFSDHSTTMEGAYIDNLEMRGNPITNDPNLVISPDSHDFGEVPIGTISMPVIFNVFNFGGPVSCIIALEDGNDFTIVSGGGFVTIGAGQYHSVEVTFAPQQPPGNKWDYLDVIVDGSYVSWSGLTGEAIYKTTLTPPTNLSAEIIDGNNVLLEWEPPSSDDWFYWGSGENFTGVGTDSVAVFDVAHKYAPSHLDDFGVTGKHLTKISFYPREVDCIYSIRVWLGGSDSPEQLVLDQVVNQPLINQWNAVLLENSVYIEGDQTLWIGYNVNTQGGHPAGCDNGPAVSGYGDMLNLNDGWVSVFDVYQYDFNWNIKGFASSNQVGGNENVIVDLNLIERPAPKEYSPRNHNLELSKNLEFTGGRQSKHMSSDAILSGYNIYRNNVLIAQNDPEILSYLDEQLPQGIYIYYVTAVYGEIESTPTESIEVEIEDVDNHDFTAEAISTKLQKIYPNPFNPNTNIAYSMSEPGMISIEVYNIRGQKVSTLMSEFKEAGNYQVTWTGTDEFNKPVSSGVYFVRMVTKEKQITRKMLLMK